MVKKIHEIIRQKRQKNIYDDKIESNASPSGSDINQIEQNDIPDFKKATKKIQVFSRDCRHKKHIFSPQRPEIFAWRLI